MNVVPSHRMSERVVLALGGTGCPRHPSVEVSLAGVTNSKKQRAARGNINEIAGWRGRDVADLGHRSKLLEHAYPGRKPASAEDAQRRHPVQRICLKGANVVPPSVERNHGPAPVDAITVVPEPAIALTAAALPFERWRSVQVSLVAVSILRCRRQQPMCRCRTFQRTARPAQELHRSVLFPGPSPRRCCFCKRRCGNDAVLGADELHYARCIIELAVPRHARPIVGVRTSRTNHEDQTSAIEGSDSPRSLHANSVKSAMPGARQLDAAEANGVERTWP